MLEFNLGKAVGTLLSTQTETLPWLVAVTTTKLCTNPTNELSEPSKITQLRVNYRLQRGDVTQKV